MITRETSNGLRRESKAQWANWKWQQKNSAHSLDDIEAFFKSWPPSSDPDLARKLEKSVRVQATPYVLMLVKVDDQGKPLDGDPILSQILPATGSNQPDAYDGKRDNWEMSADMVTPIAQRKYDNRVLIRISNRCLSYCQFCYEALRTIDKASPKSNYDRKIWQDTIRYIREDPRLDEVILSGGEPLLLSDERLGEILSDLREIDRDITIRLHTRALTFNPYRITDDLCRMFGKYEVSVVGLHITHPVEITTDFIQAVQLLQRDVPIITTNMPLLCGVNDDESTLRTMCMRLYRLGVVAGYLYHFMPYSPGTVRYRTSVAQGIDLVKRLKRRISNPAVPEFVIAHETGKHTMPLLSKGEDPPVLVTLRDGLKAIRYTNWKGDLVEYLDAQDSQ
jgi:lysine 2,3-aminomutase